MVRRPIVPVTLMFKRIASVILVSLAVLSQAEEKTGLIATFGSGGKHDLVPVSNVGVYLPEGQPATPFIEAGPTSVKWEGFVNARLRGDYKFKVAARGKFELKINDKIILSGDGKGKQIGPSEEVRLNKGANKLTATLSGTSGDLFARLTWSEYGFLWEPIPDAMLTWPETNTGLSMSESRRKGRELFLEGRCANCHDVDLDSQSGIPELEMDAPSFAGIGSRRGRDWMAKWILDPKSERSSAQMPKVLHGATAAKDAEAIADYLASLQDSAKGIEEPVTQAEAGEELVTSLHCTGCHNLPDAKEKDATKISLDHLNEKFPQGHLATFLLNPTQHYQWRRMPNFGLSKEEAGQIAGYLRSVSEGKPVSLREGAGALDEGKALLSSTGCLNCHAGIDGSKRSAKSVEELDLSFRTGCGNSTGKGPHYSLSNGQLQNLASFATDLNSLQRHSPTEFANRHSRNLNCRACHGELDGFPGYNLLGSKLKPEWMQKLFAGKITDSPRPWMSHRMPSFPALAKGLASGLAMSHGYPAVSPNEGPIDPKRAEVGRTLTGVFGGFSCVSCHGVGVMEPTQVFEAEGINLALPAERLQRDFYTRWLLNPLRIDPQSKMPVYFDEQGNSPLFDVYDGDTKKQLDAFWHYMRMGQKINPPKMDGF